MKSQVKRVAPALLLGDQRLRRVLAHERDAGVGERAHQLDRHVLDRRQDLDLRRVSTRTPRRPRRCAPAPPPGARPPGRRRAALPGEPRQPGLAARDAAVAAVGEEQLRMAAHADARERDVLRRRAPRARGARPAAGRASGRRGRRCGRCARRRRSPRGRPRSSTARSPGPIAAATSPASASRRTAVTARSTMPAATPRQPQWTIATAPGRRERDRHAVGDQHQRRHVRRVGHLRVDARQVVTGRAESLTPRRGRLVVHLHLGAVHLPAHRHARRIAAERPGEQLTVARHPRRVVVGEDAEVQRLVRAPR